MKLIIINGPPGVGKSTVAKKIHETLPLSFLLEIDEQRRNISQYRELSKESRDISYNISRSIVETCLSSGLDVIIDKAMSDIDIVDRFIQIAKKHNATVYEFVLNGGKELIIKRAEERGYREGGLLTPEKVEKFWGDAQEYLKKKSGVIEINIQNLNKEEVLQSVFDRII
jgi:broad-specificity NMP kinase